MVTGALPWNASLYRFDQLYFNYTQVLEGKMERQSICGHLVFLNEEVFYLRIFLFILFSCVYLSVAPEMCLSFCCVEAHSRNFLLIWQYVLKDSFGSPEQNVIWTSRCRSLENITKLYTNSRRQMKDVQNGFLKPIPWLEEFWLGLSVWSFIVFFFFFEDNK